MCHIVANSDKYVYCVCVYYAIHFYPYVLTADILYVYGFHDLILYHFCDIQTDLVEMITILPLPPEFHVQIIIKHLSEIGNDVYTA